MSTFAAKMDSSWRSEYLSLRWCMAWEIRIVQRLLKLRIALENYYIPHKG